jgi:hypothetical protein
VRELAVCFVQVAIDPDCMLSVSTMGDGERRAESHLCILNTLRTRVSPSGAAMRRAFHRTHSEARD